MNEIRVSTENVHKAFHAAGDNPAIQELLINLFGKENVEPEKPRDVRERIKTFDDAYNELGSEHPYCKAWDSIYHGCGDDDGEDIKDVIAYHRLRIIAAALNEGWEPRFTEEEGEYRYYPWFELITKEEIDNIDEEDKNDVACRFSNNASAYGGLFYAKLRSAFSSAGYGSHLAFKNKELAEYAGKQFIDIYADFLG